MPVRIVVHHLPTNNRWNGKSCETTTESIEDKEMSINHIAQKPSSLSLEGDDGVSYFPKKIVEQCVFKVEII